MSDFSLYFTLGRQHILDINGLDHLLFIVALCVRYVPGDWKKLLILITSFTIGHSITLLLSIFNLLHVSTRWIEFLIPVSIAITGLSNLFVKKFTFKSKYPLIYFFALFFGLIHGLGFSNYLKSLLGHSHNILVQLLAFNVGLEVGQVIVALLLLLVTFVCISLLKFNRREYLLFLSGASVGIAGYMALNRLPFIPG